ncbi:hypothetical protein GPECTOR_40g583 [Gonium pectorale]|uniref:Uncharacterized protein n=1 Tax=Gonium pectorale TaxID=33097 RepID=A0A150GAI6_GONPE|nr:hypothetical protein GPECTOR_40g583 [Gonium pectorale]|eukprot:KXZ46849.1 hypothetical protein GPECTOR_40g583 [Gonium pectorale]
MNRRVQRAIDRLSALGRRVSALDPDAEFREHELYLATEDVQVVSNADVGCLWMLVRDVDAVSGLLRLFILAAHRSLPGARGPHTDAYTELRRALSHEVGSLDSPVKTGSAADVRRCFALLSAIVKSKTLNCFSVIAASAPVNVERPSEMRTMLLEQMAVLFGVCSPLNEYDEADKERALAVEQYELLLEAELPTSGLLEHAARILLVMLQGDRTAHLATLYRNMLHPACKVFASAWDVAVRRQLSTSPCLSFLLSCHLVNACADLGCGGGGEALRLTMHSLMCARMALAGQEALREPQLPPALASRLGRWWGAAIAAVTAAASQQQPPDDLSCQVCAVLGSVTAPNGPANHPSADQSAALGAGYLRCLAAYLRTVLQPGFGAAGSVIPRLLRKHAWAQLLAFGEIREAASLVAAVAKALAEHAAALPDPGTPGAVAASQEAEHGVRLATFVWTHLAKTLLPQRSGNGSNSSAGAGGAPSGEMGPGQDGGVWRSSGGPSGERLAAVASVVLACLLPEMARLLPRLLHSGKESVPFAASCGLGLVLDMLLRLAAGLASACSASGEVQALPVNGGSDNAGCDAAESWRQLLLVELRLPALLGMALQLLQEDPAAGGGLAQGTPLGKDMLGSSFGSALAALAAWAPAELARVVAAADRAAAGGRGGRSGALPTTSLLRSVLGRDGCRPAPELLEAVQAACGGAVPQRVPAFLPPEEWEPLLHCGGLLLPPLRARELVSG